MSPSVLQMRRVVCPEDCAFCSQSTHFETGVEQYRIQSVEEMFEAAKAAYEMPCIAVLQVTSTCKPTAKEVRTVWQQPQRIKAAFPLEICASLGFLNKQAAERLAAAGVDRFNHNLETSESHYRNAGQHSHWRDRVEPCKPPRMPAWKPAVVALSAWEKRRTTGWNWSPAIWRSTCYPGTFDPRPGHVSRRMRTFVGRGLSAHDRDDAIRQPNSGHSGRRRPRKSSR